MLIVSVPAVYAGDNSVMLPIKQSCASPVLADETFTYRLRPLNPDNPMPPGSTSAGYTFTMTGNKEISVGPLTFVRQDVFRYEVYQLAETKKHGYIYDRRVYTIEIYADESFNITKIVKNESGAKESGIAFENAYGAAPTDPKLMADPVVMKTVSGNPRYDSMFAFRLAAQNASQPMPSGSVNGVKTIYISGSGRGEFGTWSYDTTGIYYYSVYEVNTGADGYSYDKTVYTITDTVKDENGQLVLSRVVANEMNKPVTSMIFNNRYSGGGTVFPPTTERPTAPETTAPTKPTDPPGTTAATTEPAGTTPPAEKPPETNPPTEPSRPEVTRGEDVAVVDPSNPPSTGRPGTEPGSVIPTEPAGTTPPAEEPSETSPPAGTSGPDVTRGEDLEWLDPEHLPGAGRWGPNTNTPQIRPVGKKDPAGPAGKTDLNKPGSIGTTAAPPISDQTFKPGLSSPKTGDETDNTFYIILFISGGILAAGSAVYLSKRKNC
ncbi:MAG: LPXTG cell wall anchor domain-containing protein [Oscillospiraceae bacterium]|nr:LPXTG cell wall anchor domain-containing protein [Oscillospiraceae bacterium]